MDITDITAGSLIILIFSFALFILMVLYISGYFDDEEEDIFQNMNHMKSMGKSCKIEVFEKLWKRVDIQNLTSI